MRLKTFAFLIGTMTLAGSLLLGAMNPQFALISAVQSAHSPDPARPAAPSDTSLHPQQPPAESVSYADGQASLKQLVDASSLIVTGTVIAQASRQDGRAVISTVEVRDRLKGTSIFHIRVIQPGQLGDPALLQSGESYALCLNPQLDASSDTYYIVGGGIQGMFLRNGHLLRNSDAAMAADLQALSDQTQLSNIDALEALIAGRLLEPNDAAPKRSAV
ncbi:hypothetical protein [Cohnella sp. REN36]|uniref:hypothetical protein n=1 Tax=Cohnella sp. REN36 TaxID=2887347 RepID=UPI001D1332D9|nr:hypothetical protein [Cohnella sp. REN36]MCC3377444.1 hypothetical protein [Cohnella sp. REN36]